MTKRDIGKEVLDGLKEIQNMYTDPTPLKLTRSPELALCDMELKRTAKEINFRAALAVFLDVPEESIDVVNYDVARLLHTVNAPVVLATIGHRLITVSEP